MTRKEMLAVRGGDLLCNRDTIVMFQTVKDGAMLCAEVDFVQKASTEWRAVASSRKMLFAPEEFNQLEVLRCVEG